MMKEMGGRLVVNCSGIAGLVPSHGQLLLGAQGGLQKTVIRERRRDGDSGAVPVLRLRLFFQIANTVDQKEKSMFDSHLQHKSHVD